MLEDCALLASILAFLALALLAFSISESIRREAMPASDLSFRGRISKIRPPLPADAGPSDEKMGSEEAWKAMLAEFGERPEEARP